MNMPRLLTLALFSLILTGCAFRPSPETHFYVLVSSAPAGGGSMEVSGPRVAVGPITIPGYLDRPQLFLRESGSAEGNLAEFHQWGEPVANGLTRVLCDALSVSLALRNGLAFPMISPMNPDWRVSVDVLSMDGAPGGLATLDAGWSLTAADGSIVLQGRFTDSNPAGSTVAELVRSQSLLAERLGKVLGEAVLTAREASRAAAGR